MAAVDYPVCLRLAGRTALVVGGGAVATARAQGLIAAGASVRVVALQATAELRAAAERGELALELRGFRVEDLAGAMLVVAAVDDPRVSEQVASAARVRGVWCTVADRPALCDFTMPSVGRRGPITVAVSTSGKAPALAARLRRRFEAQIWPEDVALASGVEALRGHLPAGPARMRFLRGLVAVVSTASAAVRQVVSAATASKAAVRPAPAAATPAAATAAPGAGR